MQFVGAGVTDKNFYIIFNVNNIGNENTTITNIGLLGFKTKKDNHLAVFICYIFCYLFYSKRMFLKESIINGVGVN